MKNISDLKTELKHFYSAVVSDCDAGDQTAKSRPAKLRALSRDKASSFKKEVTAHREGSSKSVVKEIKEWANKALRREVRADSGDDGAVQGAAGRVPDEHVQHDRVE